MRHPYQPGASYESQGRHHVGVKVEVALGRPLAQEEKDFLSRFVDDFAKLAMITNAKNDPEDVEVGRKMKADLLACFPAGTPIYVEEIPNQYGSDYYYVNKPWLKVTTPKGRITLGWRKRVIELNWEESDIAATTHDLFAAEDVTKTNRMIHCWGYDKCREYLAKLFA